MDKNIIKEIMLSLEGAALQSARETYDKLIAKYTKHPAYAQAIMDRARCIAAVSSGRQRCQARSGKNTWRSAAFQIAYW